MNLTVGLAGVGPEETAWLCLTVFIAGLVRGFSGFGTAMIYVPVAGLFLPPVSVLVTLVVFDFFGPMPLLRRAWADAVRREVLLLCLGALIGLQIGLLLLTRADPLAFRWFASLATLGLAGLLASGWRYRRVLRPGEVAGTGTVAGVFGGFAGLAGPPVILLYLGGARRAAEVRGTIILFLFVSDILTAGSLGARGLLGAEAMLLGLILTLPYALGGVIGARLFRLASEELFRAIAFALIGLAAIIGLPIFDG
ncbi:MAG: sulfite exporter TauE/SafE family protein [Pseudomonadota bacterium]